MNDLERYALWIAYVPSCRPCSGHGLCSSDRIRSTSEGPLCLRHFAALPMCAKCTRPASAKMQVNGVLTDLCRECLIGPETPVELQTRTGGSALGDAQLHAPGNCGLFFQGAHAKGRRPK